MRWVVSFQSRLSKRLRPWCHVCVGVSVLIFSPIQLREQFRSNVKKIRFRVFPRVSRAEGPSNYREAEGIGCIKKMRRGKNNNRMGIGRSLCRLNIHWSERMAVAPYCVGSQIGSSTKQATASRASELRRLLATIVAPVPSQIAVQVVRASAPLTFIPVGSSGQWWSEDGGLK
jgi:hypothetical protein